ncbi:MAG: hypothetical protein JWM56_654 [Candidatus Peribacteria bacterium]|nr:hypothetical protein [Candidatus Peribacteria bacterium]
MQTRYKVGILIAATFLIIGFLIFHWLTVSNCQDCSWHMSRDGQRLSDVNTTANAIYQYTTDNKALPDSLKNVKPGTTYHICATMIADAPGGCASSDSVFMASSLTGSYLVSMPRDPKWWSGNTTPVSCGVGCTTTSGAYTGYTVRRNADGTVTVDAPHYENHGPFTVTR